MVMANVDSSMTEPRSADVARRYVRVGLVLLALPAVVTGAWAVFAPRSWYSDYGGGAPPSAFGAYNEHFVQDLGAGFLAVGAILLFAVIWPRRDAVRVALVGFVVHTVPHFVVHLIDQGQLTRGAYFGLNAALAFGLVVALWTWWMNERPAERRSTAAK